MMDEHSDITIPFLPDNEVDELLNEEENEKFSPCRLIQRALILMIGLFLGFITILPNAMIASYSLVAARIGLTASAAFAIGGIYGAIKVEWKWLFVGLFLQVLALVVGESDLFNSLNDDIVQ